VIELRWLLSLWELWETREFIRLRSVVCLKNNYT